MKKLILWIVVVLIVIGGGAYFLLHINSAKYTPEPVVTTDNTPKVVAEGEHCGGNMANAPTCSTGLHCAPEPGTNLPFGDVGGICVKDNPAQYVSGNLLLGADATTTLGKYLIAYNGMTLYTYSKDKTGTSTCSDQCAVNWPPYVVASADSLSNIQAGVTGKVGTITRADGSMQVTYNGKPLYFFAKDAKSGDTTGQNVGKVWFVVKP
jgi:predicted lipoprotein with Yx(FWY)xxD motif